MGSGTSSPSSVADTDVDASGDACGRDDGSSTASAGGCSSEGCVDEDSADDEATRGGWLLVEITRPGCGSASQASPRPLDEAAFQHFAPFLAASQDYANDTGCRFRSDSFQEAIAIAVGTGTYGGDCKGSQIVASADTVSDAQLRGANALRAMPAVQNFASRLVAGDPELKKEAGQAIREVMAESIRSAMIAAFRERDLWPPMPSPKAVACDDCAFEDTTAALPVIAQRAWNDDLRRRRDAATGGGSGMGAVLRRAMTASFLADFAHGIGAQLEDASAEKAQQATLAEFNARIEEWEAMVADTSCSHAMEDQGVAKSQRWWYERWTKDIWAPSSGGGVRIGRDEQ